MYQIGGRLHLIEDDHVKSVAVDSIKRHPVVSIWLLAVKSPCPQTPLQSNLFT